MYVIYEESSSSGKLGILAFSDRNPFFLWGGGDKMAEWSKHQSHARSNYASNNSWSCNDLRTPSGVDYNLSALPHHPSLFPFVLP